MGGMKNEAEIQVTTHIEYVCHDDVSVQCGCDQTVLLLRHRFKSCEGEVIQ